MELHIDRLEVTAGTVPDRPGGPPGADAGGTARPGGDGVVRAGALEVRFDPGGPAGAPSTWEVANRGDRAVAVRSVAAVLGVTGSSGRLAMFRNGYQSWSACGTAVFGVDHDPSHDNTLGIEELQGAHHADQRRARPGELRSEMVTVLADGDGAWVAGFGAGTSHDGTFRLRDGAGGPELWCEAFLGDAVLAPGESRRLHPVEVLPAADPLAALDDWARRAGAGAGARTAAAYQVGWCSWYHYFHDVSEEVLRANLALAGDWPFDVFQLDDGFQSAIGDWLTTNDRFPTDLDGLAGAIAGAGRVPGIWIAPFLVAPDSAVARAHPDWIARRPDGVELLPGMFNPAWGGGLDGIMWTLDTTHPEVLDHLEHVARSLRQAGFPYLKLDFTYAPSFDGVFHDPSRTPAERVRAGYDAVRRGAGDDAFLLGCGAPLSHVVGVVDGNRIGSDVAPSWTLPPDHQGIPGYQDGEPATLHAFRNTLARSFLHRRLWLNDPDCLMLRTEDTALTPEAMRTWAHAVAVSGGMALVSDDLALLGPEARRLLDEVVAIGRVADEEARTGAAPRVPDLLEPGIPTTIEGGGHRLVTDPATAGSSLT